MINIDKLKTVKIVNRNKIFIPTHIFKNKYKHKYNFIHRLSVDLFNIKKIFKLK